MIERRYSLSQAAKLAGVGRKTLRAWLEIEGYVFPIVAQGEKVLLRESDVEKVLRRREARSGPRSGRVAAA